MILVRIWNRFVADKMGGRIEREELHHFCWELEMSAIQFEQKSNIVPIGKIKRGTFYHRALLFKVHYLLFCNITYCW